MLKVWSIHCSRVTPIFLPEGGGTSTFTALRGCRTDGLPLAQERAHYSSWRQWKGVSFACGAARAACLRCQPPAVRRPSGSVIRRGRLAEVTPRRAVPALPPTSEAAFAASNWRAFAPARPACRNALPPAAVQRAPAYVSGVIPFLFLCFIFVVSQVRIQEKRTKFRR